MEPEFHPEAEIAAEPTSLLLIKTRHEGTSLMLGELIDPLEVSNQQDISEIVYTDERESELCHRTAEQQLSYLDELIRDKQELSVAAVSIAGVQLSPGIWTVF